MQDPRDGRAVGGEEPLFGASGRGRHPTAETTTSVPKLANVDMHGPELYPEIHDEPILDNQILLGAWEEERNGRFVEARWRFTTANARIKLHRLYPSIQP